tara:strand:+ start:1552 stop:1719 length:168 start_codon:yes stop_codon:yes gene_type:complete
VEYIDPKIEVVDQESSILSSGWKRNNASGIIHRELLMIQEGETTKLREGHFEATG